VKRRHEVCESRGPNTKAVGIVSVIISVGCLRIICNGRTYQVRIRLIISPAVSLVQPYLQRYTPMPSALAQSLCDVSRTHLQMQVGPITVDLVDRVGNGGVICKELGRKVQERTLEALLTSLRQSRRSLCDFAGVFLSHPRRRVMRRCRWLANSLRHAGPWTWHSAANARASL
jgi:hypothetical protein